MANDDDKEEISEEDRVSLLEASAKTTRKLLFVSAFCSLLLITIMIGGYITIGFTVASGSQVRLAEMEKLTAQAEEEFSSMNLTVEFYTHQMDLLSDRLNGIKPSIDHENFAILENVMRSQEMDFQSFLQTVKSAVHSLAEMIPGSRDWRDDFNSKLDSAIVISEDREKRFTEKNQGENNPDQSKPAVNNLSQN